MSAEPTNEQRELCESYRAIPDPVSSFEKLGVARDVRPGAFPLNGLRHPRERGTCGWYLWVGSELSPAPDFFSPLHVHHLEERSSEAVVFLALPPGWRFLLAAGHVDVWFDATLLESR
jgi:hypothetical protein